MSSPLNKNGYKESPVPFDREALNEHKSERGGVASQ
jgi:hypothetical protein